MRIRELLSMSMAQSYVHELVRRAAETTGAVVLPSQAVSPDEYRALASGKTVTIHAAAKFFRLPAGSKILVTSHDRDHPPMPCETVWYPLQDPVRLQVKRDWTTR